MKLMEEFEQVGTTKLDTKKRITLGTILKKFGLLEDATIDDFETYIGDKGDILLRPRTSIPTRELWVYKNPKILNSIKKGMADIKAGRVTKVKNVDKFLEEL